MIRVQPSVRNDLGGNILFKLPTRAPKLGVLPLLLLLIFASTSCSLGSSSPQNVASKEKGGSAKATAPWQIPPQFLGTQRLYRVSFQDRENKLAFRLTLYLQEEEKFRVEASDGIGRKVFSLAVDGPALTYADHRNRTFCQTSDNASLNGLPFVTFPPSALSRVILGILPVEPVLNLAQDAESVSFQDGEGRSISAGLQTDGSLAWWSVAENQEPVIWWQKQKGESIFSDRHHQQQVRWVELVVEPLVAFPETIEAPEGYSQHSCASAPDLTQEP